MTPFKLLTLTFVCTAGIVIAAGPATAGGFGPVSGVKSFANAYGQQTIAIETGDVHVVTTTQAGAKTFAKRGGMAGGDAVAGNRTIVVTKRGKVAVVEHSTARAKTFKKNGNVLAKAKATNHLKVYAEGQLLFDNTNSAYAMARQTPLGTHAAAGAVNDTRFVAKGHSRLETGQVVRASTRNTH